MLAVRFDFTIRKFEMADVIVCRDCKKHFPLPKGSLVQDDGFSGYRAREDGNWNVHTLTFDVGRLVRQHPEFNALTQETCPVFDEAEMASMSGHGL